ncbi:hypothetical protein MK489_07980 [Myxococcota bacterium]|nr:hypothetical protein [Myxococcota bacterium]
MNPKKLRLLMFGTSLTVALGVGPVQASKIKNESISGGEAAYLNSYTGPSSTAGARAKLVRASNGTTVTSVSAWGLEPDREYMAHVHALPCALGAGGHYQDEPGGAVDAINEIWPGFTTDGTGVGRAEVVNDFTVRPDAMSVVIHDTPNAASGAGAKMLCADLNRGDQGAVVNRGEFEPFASAEAIDETIAGTGSLSVSSDGKTIVLAAVTGLDPIEEYRSHVHNLPCDVDDAGPHYKIDPTEPGTIEDNEMWLTIAPDAVGDAYFKASFDTIARPDAQSIVIHRCADSSCSSKPKIACANLSKVGPEIPLVESGQATAPFSAGADEFAAVKARSVEFSTKTNGKTKIRIKWEGLPSNYKGEEYPSHVHNLPCSVQNGGGHYKIDPEISGAIENNEMWLNFKQSGSKKTVSKTFNTTPRADAQSIVLHRPVTAERIACIDLDFESSSLD